MKKFTLEDIEKKEPFEAPDKYFDELPLRMQRRIEESKHSSSRVLLLSPQWAVPSLALLMLLVGLFIWNNESTQVNDLDPLESIATADLADYLELELVSSYELVQVFNNAEDVDSLWSDSELNLLPEDNMTDNDLLLLFDQMSIQDEVL